MWIPVEGGSVRQAMCARGTPDLVFGSARVVTELRFGYTLQPDEELDNWKAYRLR